VLVTLRASEAAAQCIVIAPVCLSVCLFVFVCLWVCYKGNSKLRASILTKLGLQVKVVTIYSWLNFGRLEPREGGLCGWTKFLAPPYYSQRSVCVSSGRFFHLCCILVDGWS